MPRLKYRHKTTGKTVEFDWDKPDKPNPDQLRQIFSQQEESEKPKPSTDLWSAANKPIVSVNDQSLPGTGGRTMRDIGREMTQPGLNDSPWGARLKGFVGGSMEAVGDIASSFTSPLSLGLTATTAGSGAAASLGLGRTAAALGNVERAAGAGMASHGAYKVYSGDSLSEKAGGALELAGGLAGYRGGTNRVRRATPRPSAGQPNVEPVSGGGGGVELSGRANEPTPQYMSGRYGIDQRDWLDSNPLYSSVPKRLRPPSPTETYFDNALPSVIRERVQADRTVGPVSEAADPTPATKAPKVPRKQGQAQRPYKDLDDNSLKALAGAGDNGAIQEVDLRKPRLKQEGGWVGRRPTGSPVSDIAAGNVGKDAAPRKGKVTYNGGDVTYTVDYDNPHPKTGVFPTVKIKNGKQDPFTNYTPEYQIPFLEDIDRMHRQRTGNTIDITPVEQANRYKSGNMTANIGEMSAVPTELSYEALEGVDPTHNIDPLSGPRTRTGLGLGSQRIDRKAATANVPVSPMRRLLDDNRGFINVPGVTKDQLKKGALDVANAPRTIMASVDLSAPLRQGAVFVGKKEFWKALPDMFKAAGSQKGFDALKQEIAVRPSFPVMKKSGLFLADLMGDMSKREEAFMSSLPEKIPGIGQVIKASNRGYTGFLNKLRADVFDDLMSKAEGTGAMNDSLPKGIADFVNNATGRGNLGQLEQSAEALNAVFFSPRLIASRVNMLNPVTYAKMDPFVRKEAIKSMLQFAAAGNTVLGLAKLAGADVELDPRSSDFGKMRFGNTRIDPWGGFQQYVRVFSQLVSGQTKSPISGQVKDLGSSPVVPTRKDVAVRFAESKLAPVPSLLDAWLNQHDSNGEPVSMDREVLKRMTPLLMQDLYDVAKDNPNLLPASAIAGTFGMGVQTFGRTAPRRRARSGRSSRYSRRP